MLTAPPVCRTALMLFLGHSSPFVLSPNSSQDWQASTSERIHAAGKASWINSCYLDRAHTTTNESSGSQYSCSAVEETARALFNTDTHARIGE